MEQDRTRKSPGTIPGLLVIVGPTGTGKSALAVEVASALNGEIVGCDALQVYRKFEIATAKPTAPQRARVPHHLIDVLDPRTDCTMADYVRAAERILAEIAARNKPPLVVGGTGLYLRGLLRGVIPAPARDPRLRARLERVARLRGSSALHRWLERLDPQSAARLAPGDRQRLTRALEVALHGEETWSERLRSSGAWDHGVERYRALKIGLTMDRRELGRRLDERVEGFFRAGLVDEVRSLLESGVPASANAFKAIGYREVLAALLAGDDPSLVIGEVQRNTRRYAKRQRSWFAKEPEIVWLEGEAGLGRLTRRVLELWAEFTTREGVGSLPSKGVSDVLYSRHAARPSRVMGRAASGGTGMEGESRNLQNDFFNAARRARSPVAVFLNNGKKLTGRIKSFDKFTLLLEGHQGELVVFKHAISTVSMAARGSAESSATDNRNTT